MDVFTPSATLGIVPETLIPVSFTSSLGVGVGTSVGEVIGGDGVALGCGGVGSRSDIFFRISHGGVGVTDGGDGVTVGCGGVSFVGGVTLESHGAGTGVGDECGGTSDVSSASHVFGMLQFDVSIGVGVKGG